MFIIFVVNYRSYYMSPRPLRLRKISNPPIISGFKPYGNKTPGKTPEIIFLKYEEYESLRLCDHEMLNHHQASVIMDVSRPTLTRIYARARQKIAEALVFGKQIIIEGGKVYFNSEWFSCRACGCFFNNPEKQNNINECPLCRSKDFENCNDVMDEDDEFTFRCSDMCICPTCGHEQPHNFGKPCMAEICPECGHSMVRKGTPHNKKSIKNKRYENSYNKHRKQFGK
jgi:predicted DNA-binding protein (UPF0251 family)